MRRRWTTWLAWSLWAVWVVLFVTLLFIGTDPSRALVAVAATFAMVTVGALVASRRPANPIGWIFCALGLGFIVGGLSSEYATRALVDAPGSLPGGLAIGWLSSWVQMPTTMLVLYLLLLFPNGHPPSPRWRGVVWLVTALIALSTLTAALRPGPLQPGPTAKLLPVDNPLAIEAIAPLLEVVSAVSLAALLALLVAAIVSVILRFRRSRGEERQQMKWFVYASGFVPAIIASNVALRALPEGLRAPLQTAFLASVALFQPLRRRIQRAVDRRFYRSTYDAERTLDAFAVRLRDEVDLEAVRAHLLGVVHDTVRPAHASVWLRERGHRARLSR